MTRPMKRPRASHAEIIAEARRHTGVWMPVGTYRARYSAVGIVGQINTASGAYATYAPAGSFEARMQAVGDETEVSVRYLGPVGDAPAAELSEQQLAEIAARAADREYFVSDCEAELQVWAVRALEHVSRNERGEITGWSEPGSYLSADRVVALELDSGTWDPGEDADDDLRRQDINDLVDARAALPALLAELERLSVEHDRALGEVIGERDRCENAADKLAYAVAPIEGIGEHSSGNDPWENALDLITPFAEVEKLRARVAELEAAAAKVAEFVAERAEVVAAGRNCHPDNHSERGRWQGHAEARRVLANTLGLPVAWPAETTVGGDPR